MNFWAEIYEEISRITAYAALTAFILLALAALWAGITYGPGLIAWLGR